MKLTKRSIYKFLTNIHIYGGLFSAVYLLVVGVSVLNFQHQFLPETPTDTIRYTRTIQFDESLKADSLAQFVRDELKIKGYIPYWEYRENIKKGQLRFMIQRPALSYEIKLDRKSDEVKINEIHYSTGRILRAMHFGSIRNQLGDPMLDIWARYSQLAALFAFLAVATSIYFWFKKSVRSRKQWFAVIVSGLFSIVYIVYIWLIG